MYSVSPFPLASGITHTQLVYPLVGHDYQFQDRNSSPDRSYLARDIMYIFLRINLNHLIDLKSRQVPRGDCPN